MSDVQLLRRIKAEHKKPTTAGYVRAPGRTTSGSTDSEDSIDDRGTGRQPTIGAACPSLAAIGTLNRPGYELDSDYAGAGRNTPCGASARQVS
jgi:hypothetical protein